MEWPSILFRPSSVIFRCQKYVKKRVHGNEKMNLPWDFKKVCWVIFRGQKYVKKGYMEMRKWIFLVPLKGALGRSILHYWVLFLFSFEVFALLGLLSLTTFWVSVDKILLASSTLLEFSDNNSKLFEVEIGLVNDVLIFDASCLGIGSVWIFVFLSTLPVLCSE